METTQADLCRPFLFHAENHEEEERPAAAAATSSSSPAAAARIIIDEWNASVAAFVAENGGDDNLSCYYDESTGTNSNLLVESNTTTTTITSEENNNNVGEELSASDFGMWCAEWASKEKFATICTSTLLPDGAVIELTNDNEPQEDDDSSQIAFQQMETSAAIKFGKLVLITIASIALVRKAVIAIGIDDRDTMLTFKEILVYEGDSILRDLMFFFVVGKLHQRSGIDTIEWIGFGLLANLYFESQNLFSWMQHAATPYEMHCLWPWQLWVFATLVVFGSLALGMTHAVVAYQQNKLQRILAELLVCSVGFILPVAFSPYAHFHHWFAGWFLGMHAKLHNRWWSRATMAYCWGMYVNGIAVYGRDPLLTCDYARFLARDQGCPTFNEQELDSTVTTNALFLFLEQLFSMSEDPPDWRNCTSTSSSGYHP